MNSCAKLISHDCGMINQFYKQTLKPISPAAIGDGLEGFFMGVEK